ncbi:hypothetical protein KAFR_0K01930 [Kazachstania africana CBS 2517]|uniref:HTH APSES-type domain-containing protein n=1 Tax=Kazachstania africana (strain ATCC 22294 / BCRC 22015 / CBS 2517 / CECT 1963 / NBRC 1671 / NRRL Y-8276) TaxID=1071382 RepID=H2B1P7_KAZAF|nr:hypothetical protein KAFR_0K01930 [Kazachstania africana CBS 2517]CCF60547.1 hypothetical protein KAFR_0K01930 [Kazachstania africana CBS 2517]
MVNLTPDSHPIIEIATYSDTDVYECYIRGFESRVVMRRTRDDWVNITQVFKIAQFSKTQRTKLLEKESMNIQHEKVQGGYGRFQGTWVPLDAARDIAAKYSIQDPVATVLLNFQPNPTNPPPRRTKNSILRKTSPGTLITSPSSYNKTPRKKNNSVSTSGNVNSTTNVRKNKRSNSFQNNPSPLHNMIYQTPQQFQIQNTGSNDIGTIKKFNEQLIDTLPSVNENSSVQNFKSSQNGLHIKPSSLYATTQKPLQFYSVPTPANSNTMKEFHQLSEKKDDSIPNPHLNGAASVVTSKQHRKYNRKRATNHVNRSIHEQATTNTNDNNTRNMQTLDENEYKQAILQVLATEEISEETKEALEGLKRLPPGLDINFLVDDQDHTSLHWAAAMANRPLVKLLISLNANALQCNSLGFNCVTKAVFYNNCYKQSAFSDILSMLKICLVTPDRNGRLPLHYLVELSVNKSKDPEIINSYIDMIIHSIGNEDYELLEMCLNYQDNTGNTVLHLAALNLNLGLFNKLCSLGSLTNILNIDNETPATILSRYNLVPPTATAIISPMEFTQPLPGTSFKTEADDDQFSNKATSLDDGDRMNKSNRPTNENNSRELIHSDSTNLNSMLEDISSLDSLVTSSVIRDPKATDGTIFNQSPMLYKERPAKAAFAKVKQSSLNHSISLDDAIEPLTPIKVASDKKNGRVRKGGERKGSVLIEITGKLLQATNKLTSTIDSNVILLTSDIGKLESRIRETDTVIKSAAKRKDDLLSSFKKQDGKLNDVNEIKKENEDLEKLLANTKQSFAQCIEKSQALSLATLVQDEESKVEDLSKPTSSESTFDKEEMYKLFTELTVLQLKRRHLISKVSNKRGSLNTSEKINKYKTLIGFSSEDSESMLDDLEKDLMVASQ